MAQLQTASDEILIGIPTKKINGILNTSVFSGKPGDTACVERWSTGISVSATLRPERLLVADLGFQPGMSAEVILRQHNWQTTSKMAKLEEFVRAQLGFLQAVTTSARNLDALNDPLQSELSHLPYSLSFTAAIVSLSSFREFISLARIREVALWSAGGFDRSLTLQTHTGPLLFAPTRVPVVQVIPSAESVALRNQLLANAITTFDLDLPEQV